MKPLGRIKNIKGCGVMNSSSRFLIITGMSGAGKSQVMHALEDIGFFCVDNLPVPLVPKLAELLRVPNSEINKIALGIDTLLLTWRLLGQCLCSIGGVQDHAL